MWVHLTVAANSRAGTGAAGTVLHMGSKGLPGLEFEKALGDAHGWPVFAFDEVGRGAIAGPVCVGVTVIDEEVLTRVQPAVKDSKLMSAPARENVIASIKTWAPTAVGEASAEEIDQYGMMRSLRLAAERALAKLSAQGYDPAVALVDGNYDWLTRPEAVEEHADRIIEQRTIASDLTVVVKVKADMSCAAVAAASVVAKVHRDALVADLDRTGTAIYGFDRHAGYGTKAHYEAIELHGLSRHHRRTFCKRYAV